VKNIIDNIAITLLILLFMFIVAMIIQYKIIDNVSSIEPSYVSVFKEEKVLPKEKRENYLESLETYTEVEVEVDPRKDQHINRVEITSEIANNEMELAISNAHKSTFIVEKLNIPKKKSKIVNRIKTDDEIRLEHEKIADEIGIAIGAALEDI